MKTSSKNETLRKMEKLVGRRYANLGLLKYDIETVTGRITNAVIESESDRDPDCDYMIDYEFVEQEDVYTLFYLKDNAGNYYITEV